MENNKKTEYRAPALEKGLEILELLAAADEPLSKKQIAEKLNRSINEIFRMLSVLVNKKYIEFDNEFSVYTLTLKMFALSNQHPPVALLLKNAQPLMEDLSVKLNQSCHLSLYQNHELVVISKQESPYKMGFSLRVGVSLDILGSGSGLVLLSYLSKQDQQHILNKCEASDEEREHALNLSESIIKDGHFIGESPQISGVTNISVPIFSVLGDILAILTIPYMTLNTATVHHHVENIEHARDELITVAEKLNHNLTKC
ncbi:IclR family transcriptional regulator [Psychromonas sp. RZ22]|nr:IclR family transcriptional regulator [Psychromonas sp. RZ22]